MNLHLSIQKMRESVSSKSATVVVAVADLQEWEAQAKALHFAIQDIADEMAGIEIRRQSIVKSLRGAIHGGEISPLTGRFQ